MPTVVMIRCSTGDGSPHSRHQPAHGISGPTAGTRQNGCPTIPMGSWLIRRTRPIMPSRRPVSSLGLVDSNCKASFPSIICRGMGQNGDGTLVTNESSCRGDTKAIPLMEVIRNQEKVHPLAAELSPRISSEGDTWHHEGFHHHILGRHIYRWFAASIFSRSPDV